MPSIFDQEIGMDKWMRKEKVISDPESIAYESTNGNSTLSSGSSILSGGGSISNEVQQTNVSSLQSGETGAILAYRKKNFVDTAEGWIQGLDTDGVYKWLIGGSASSIDWSVTTASTLTIVGAITSTTGNIGGFTIGADYIRDTANSFGLASTVSGSDDVRFWAGATFANRATAPVRIYESGNANLATVTLGGSLSVSTSGAIYSGQTAYNTGTGYWWEYNAGTPRASIGDPAGNYLTWDGSALTVKGVVIATSATITGTSTDTFTINDDLTDSNVDLILGRTTGGNATLRWNGTTVNIDKSFTVSGTAVVLTSRTLTAGAGLTGGGDLSADRTFAVGAGNGITVNADDVALTTPGTLTVSSSNSSSGNHTHAITSSSNPGAAASILATDSSGFLTVVKLSTDTLADKSGGNLTISPAGDVIFDPNGNDLLPNTGYDLNLGSLAKKYLTLHAAELWVETLVAQNTIATIGGRILVGPTTTLTRDLTDVATTIYVKHNEMASGDRVYLEANAKVEFMSVDSAPTLEAEGDYSYTVTRNLDGTGANVWNAGDAMFNTGTTGDGFIDIYSVAGVKAGTEYGPAIAGNVRNSATYNDWSTHWAIGNLNGVYGYGVTTYGVGFGEYAAAKTHLTLDSTNGLRFFNGTATVIGQWDTSGNISVGNTASEHVYITSTGVQFKDSTNVYTDLTAGVLTLGLVSGGEYTTIDGTNGIKLYTNAVAGITLSNAGVITVGEVGASKSNILISSNAIYLRTNTTNKITLGTDGNLSLTGALSIGTAGSFSSGQTNYDTGTGFWLDYNTGTPRFSLGNSAGNKITWDGSTLSIVGGIDISSKLDKTGGAYASAASGSRVLIFPDANTGLQIIDDASNDVFKALVGGTDVGDVIMGSESAGKYAKWDKSAGTLIVTGSNIVYPFTCGENITAGNAVIVGNAESHDGETMTTNEGSVGSVTGTTWWGQSFTTSSSAIGINAVVLHMQGVGGTNNVTISIRSTLAGSDIESKTATVAVSSNQAYTFTFSSAVTVSPSTIYYIIVRESGANSSNIYGKLSSGSGFNTSSDSGANWIGEGDNEAIHTIKERHTTAGLLYKSNASANNEFMNFIGFATETATAGNSCLVSIGTINANQSGLSVGLPYYLSNTPGAISTVAGSVSKKIGLSLSATSLLILNT
jgi:hypothetical protein